MSNGTLLRAKGNHMPFIIIAKVKINRHLDWDGMVLVEIEDNKSKCRGRHKDAE